MTDATFEKAHRCHIEFWLLVPPLAQYLPSSNYCVNFVTLWPNPTPQSQKWMVGNITSRLFQRDLFQICQARRAAGRADCMRRLAPLTFKCVSLKLKKFQSSFFWAGKTWRMGVIGISGSRCELSRMWSKPTEKSCPKPPPLSAVHMGMSAQTTLPWAIPRWVAASIKSNVPPAGGARGKTTSSDWESSIIISQSGIFPSV